MFCLKPQRPLTLLFVAGFALAFVLPLRADESAQDPGAVYQEALTSGQYAEAELAAKRRLQKAIRDGQRDQLSTVELLNDLAFAQYNNDDFDAALQNYELAISIVESNTDMLNMALVRSLLGIGAVQVRSGRPDLALLPVERALHVYAVNEGPHSLSQSAALELLADAYLAMSDYASAVDIADRLVILHNRHYSDGGREVVPALMRKGEILRQALEWREERDAYSEAMSILRKHGAASSPLYARPLIGLGASHQAEYFYEYLEADAADELPDEKLLEKAEKFFVEAIEHARNADPSDWRITAEAIIALADFYILAEQPVRARRHYRDAWQWLSETPERALERRQLLEKITPLLQPKPDLSVAMPPADDEEETRDYDTGYLVVQFTVNRRGRLADIGLRETKPERNEAVEAEVKRALTRFVYRPRFVNGRAVATPDQQIRYQFPVVKRTDGQDD
jgi:tetratricopeptide (TPR) repeat protein